MALQTRKLVMLGLGIQNDLPPNSIQPRLPDGIHLRWAFDATLGFPWYGFYLFRKLHRLSNRRCLSNELREEGFVPGNTNEESLFFDHISVRDAHNGSIIFSDLFSQTGVVEFDLRASGLIIDPPELHFSFRSNPACNVEVTLGLTGNDTVNITALFQGIPVAQTTVSTGASFPIKVTLKADMIGEVRVSSQFGKTVVADICYTRITDEARSAEWAPVPGFPQPLCLPISHPDYPCHSGPENFGRAWIEARRRKRYGTALCDNPTLYSIGTISVVTGSVIVIGSGTNWTSALVGAAIQFVGDPSIYIIAAVLGPNKLILDRAYAGATRSNVPYSIRQDDFAELYDDLIALVQGGPAAGPMFNRSQPKAESLGGTITVTGGSDRVIGAGTNWSAGLAGLSLVVARNAPGTVFISSGQSIIAGFGTNWDASIVGMTIQITGDPSLFIIDEVTGPDRLTLNRSYVGPRVNDQTYQLFDYDTYRIAAVLSPTELQLDRPYARDGGSNQAYRIAAPYRDEETDPELEGPAIYRQYLLDLVLLASIDPGIAQMLGLYWIDTQVVAGVGYDYLLVADYNGAAALSAANALALVQAGTFSNIEVAMVCNKRREPATALARPDQLRAFALPGSITAPDKSTVALSWDLGITNDDILLPDRPVLYHLWRVGPSATRPASAPPSSSYLPITGDGPVLAARPELASGEVPQFPPDWPPPEAAWPFGPLAFDHGVADGWYSYQINGVDIFGRHSPNSAVAQWYQWAPPPDPRPWYYTDPATARPVSDPAAAFALEVRDQLAPPPPAGVEAYALDPRDTTVLQDAAYTAWRNAHPNVVGLRVRWHWTSRHQALAPDINEFRIYFHPGAQLPRASSPEADHTAARSWQDRVFVVGYNNAQYLRPESTAELQVYEVFLPRTGDPALSAGLPLTTSSAAPIAYAHIGVSAADTKTYGVDPRGAGRTGNEGRVGTPARIFRIHRDPPNRPVLPDSEDVFASPADYHNRSFYTYRWPPADFLKTHIFRALDDTLFQVDLVQRPRAPLDPFASDIPEEQVFPSDWNTDKRQQVADELNQLNGFGGQTAQAIAYYRSLSNDGLRVLANLPGNERAFSQITVQPLDPNDPANADRRGPDSPEDYPPNGALRAYIDTLDGRSTSRYFYRMAYVDGANNRSRFSMAGPPIYLPKTVPPLAPTITKALGGQRQAIIQWSAHPVGAASRYRVYRTESRENATDLRLMGEPVGDLPAEPLVVLEGAADLGPNTDIVQAERVYDATGFNPSADLLTGQTATQYLAAPVAVTGTRVEGLAAANNRAVVVVYRDQQDGLQYTPVGQRPRVWVDQGLVGARMYFYRVVAIGEGETRDGSIEIQSLPSAAAGTRVVDQTPPAPPTITSIEWVRLGPGGSVFPYSDPIPEGEERIPAVRLNWTATDPQLVCLVQYRLLPDGRFVNASGWLPRGVYQLVHPNQFDFQDLEYRVKVINQAGNANVDYNPVTLPVVP